MQSKIQRFGPVAIAASAGNLLNPPTTTGGVNAGTPATYILLRHFRVVNRTSGSVNVSLWIGLTGGSASGTEYAFSASPVAANNWLDYYATPGTRLDATDFLTGLASAASSLTIEGEYEIAVAG